MNNENRQIVEINGIKIEADLSTARKIDTFKVGDNVKLLKKKYSLWYAYPGMITSFANFKSLPTIVVAYVDTNDYSINFEHINADNKNESEIILISDEELKISRDGIIEKFNHAIENLTCKLENLKFQKDYFIRNFLKNQIEIDSDLPY